MSLQIDSDLDSSVNDDEVESDKLPISKELAKSLYDKAGKIAPEDEEEITPEKYHHLLKDSVALIIENTHCHLSFDSFNLSHSIVLAHLKM